MDDDGAVDDAEASTPDRPLPPAVSGCCAWGPSTSAGPDDFHIPDAGLLPGPHGVWHDTAVLVVEVLSPDDATFDELDFSTAHGVRELLVVDWQRRSIRCLAMQDGQVERERSEVLDDTTAALEAALDWPPLDDEPRG